MKPAHAHYLEELLETRRRQFHASVRDELAVADLCRAQCRDFATKFVERFPDLRLQGGFFGGDPCDPGQIADFSYVEHWWCVDVDGTIVDPTRAQFLRTEDVYIVYDPEKHPVYLGRCMNCGEEIYGLRSIGRQSVCSEECEIEITDHCNHR